MILKPITKEEFDKEFTPRHLAESGSVEEKVWSAVHEWMATKDRPIPTEELNLKVALLEEFIAPPSFANDPDYKEFCRRAKINRQFLENLK